MTLTDKPGPLIIIALAVYLIVVAALLVMASLGWLPS
jgi:hypothetical protein